jgi:hypothetical protein
MIGDTKIKKAIIATLFTMLLATAAYATYYIWSQQTIEVQVKVPQLTLYSNYTAPITPEAYIKFWGTLTLNGNGIPDKTVKLYANNSYTGLSATTNNTGYYEIIWQAPYLGYDYTYSFNTTVGMP